MKQVMKKVVAVVLVMALAFGTAQGMSAKKVQAAGKYALKVKNITMEVGQQKDANVKTKSKMKPGKTGTSAGYGVKKTKYKVISGKKIVSVKDGMITAKKAGTAKVMVTVVYVDYINALDGDEGYFKEGKKQHKVGRSFKVKVKKASPIAKDKCKVADENMTLKVGDSDEKYVNSVYNKPRTFYAKPVLSYKVISGGEHVKVTIEKEEDSAYISVASVSAGTAEIELTTSYQKYQVSTNGKKDKLVDKNYATSVSKIMVTVQE